MDFNTSFLVFALGISAPVISLFLLYRESRNTYEESDPDKRHKKRIALKAAQIITWVGFILQLIIIWQGLWLIHSDYTFNLSGSDPSTLGRTAARGGGKGGLIILILIFFPYFLIGGFGFLAYTTFLLASKILPKQIKQLEDKEKEIQSMPFEQRQVWTESMRTKEEEELKKIRAQREAERLLKIQLKNQLNDELKREPEWLNDKSKEGWLINGKTVKHFLRVPNTANNMNLITEETGLISENQAPVITKKILLTKKEAQSDWKYYLKNRYRVTTPKWK